MLGTLITSKTRIKILLKFFLNSEATGHLKKLASEFNDSSNGLRVELNKLESIGLLQSESVGNKKVFKANTGHPMYENIHRIVFKYTGIEQIVEGVIERLGELSMVYLVGALAKGLDSKIIDIVLVGNVNREYLITLIDKVEPEVMKRVRYVIYSETEFEESRNEVLSMDHLLIWGKDTSRGNPPTGQ
jgi:predicted nucleotidyltransferase